MGPGEESVADHAAAESPEPTEAARRDEPRPPVVTEEARPSAGNAWQAVLPNGLRVVGQQDPQLHSAAVCVLYAVGTADDPNDHTGLAHLTEHLMFKPVGQLPTGFHGLLEPSGATAINASTHPYSTKYCSAIPDAALERALFGEGERMAYLLDGLTEETVEGERQVVLNEADERGEGGPGARLRRLVLEPLHPEGHPIWRALRVQEDVEDLELRDVQWFHQRYYSPRNAVLAVVSPRPATAVLALVRRYLGHVRGSAAPEARDFPSMSLDDSVSITFRSRIRTPQLYVLWPTPAYYAPGDAAMDYAAQHLEPLLRSRLPRRTVLSVSVRQVSSLEGSYFRVHLSGVRDTDMRHYLPAIEDAVSELRSELISEERHTRIRAAVVSFAGESPWARASRMGDAVLFGREPRTSQQEIERYGSVTREALRAAARRHLHPRRRVVVEATHDAEAIGDGSVDVRRGSR
jgi:zinc protease